MKLIILGSGSGLITKKRGAPGYWLQIGKTKMLLDAGEGTLDRMIKLGLKPEELDYVFISHKHIDHFADVFPLGQYLGLKNDYYLPPRRKTKPVIIYSSTEMNSIFNGINRQLRIMAYHSYLIFKVLPRLKRFTYFTVKSTKLLHIGKKNNLAFKFITKQKVFTYTGDVCWTQELIEFCRGSDILLIDTAFSWDGDKYHLSASQAGRVGTEAGAKILILTHFYPLGQKRKRKYNPKKEAAKYFRGKIIAAEDLLSINL